MPMLALATAIVRAWTLLYTSRLPASVRNRRRAEIDSDLWELAHDGSPASRAAVSIVLRLLRGVPDDLRWCLEEGGSMRRTTTWFVIAAAAIVLAAAWTLRPLLVASPLPPVPPAWSFAASPPHRYPPPPPPPLDRFQRPKFLDKPAR